MNSSVGASWVAYTIFINHSTWKLGLLEFSSKSSVLKKLFACISWIPKLDRSGWDCYKSKIIWFSWPLDIENSIVTSWKSKEHFFSLNIINVHIMIIALVNSCDISLAWRDRESSYSFSFVSKLEASNWLHCDIIPNMNCWQFSTLSSHNNISKLTTSSVNGRDVILVERKSLHILFSIFILFNPSEKLLLPRSEILNNS